MAVVVNLKFLWVFHGNGRLKAETIVYQHKYIKIIRWPTTNEST